MISSSFGQSFMHHRVPYFFNVFFAISGSVLGVPLAAGELDVQSCVTTCVDGAALACAVKPAVSVVRLPTVHVLAGTGVAAVAASAGLMVVGTVAQANVDGSSMDFTPVEPRSLLLVEDDR